MLFVNASPLWIYKWGQFLFHLFSAIFMCSLCLALDHRCWHCGNWDTPLSQTYTLELAIKRRLWWRWAENLSCLWQPLAPASLQWALCILLLTENWPKESTARRRDLENTAVSKGTLLTSVKIRWRGAHHSPANIKVVLFLKKKKNVPSVSTSNC